MKISIHDLEKIITEELKKELNELDASGIGQSVVDFFSGGKRPSQGEKEEPATDMLSSPLTKLQQAKMAYKIITDLQKIASVDKDKWAKAASLEGIEEVLKKQIKNYQEKDGRDIYNLISSHYSNPNKLLEKIKRIESLQKAKQQSKPQAAKQTPTQTKAQTNVPQTATPKTPSKPILSGPLRNPSSDQQQRQGKKS